MVNIQNVMESVCRTLDGFLKDATQSTEDIVALANLTNSDGTRSPIVTNKVVLSLANIEQISLAPGNRGSQASPAATELYVCAFANFEGGRYATGLDLIGRVIGYMQDKPIFDRMDIPDLDASIEKLSFEFVNMDAVQWSHTLLMFGVSYLPVVMYKMRFQLVRS